MNAQANNEAHIIKIIENLFRGAADLVILAVTVCGVWSLTAPQYVSGVVI